MFKNKILGFFLACSENIKEVNLSDSAINTGYVEYLFCDFGPDMSQESFSEMLVEWTLDGLETAVPMSVGLLPRTETDMMVCGLLFGNLKNRQKLVGKNGWTAASWTDEQ